MSQSSTRRWPRLAHLVFLAGYASATFTLTNFEDITDKVSLKSCRSAYNTPLTDCELQDFTQDNACSTKCVASIKEAQKAIQKACADVSVDSSSLLSRGQEGQLVNSLCSSIGRDDDDTTTTESKKESTKTRSASVTTSVIRKTSTTAETSTTEPAQTTSLVLAGSGGDSDLPTEAVQSILPSSSTSSAAASETAKSNGSGRGGDPFATPQNSGATALSLGFTAFLMSTVVGLVAVM